MSVMGHACLMPALLVDETIASGENHQPAISQ